MRFRPLAGPAMGALLVIFGACSASESNEIDNSSDNLDLAPGSDITITSCEKDDLDRPVAEVSITSSSEGGGPFFVRVRFESTDGNTDYGDATEDGGLGEVGGPQTESTVRVTGPISAPTAVRCILRNGSVNVTGGASSTDGTSATPTSSPQMPGVDEDLIGLWFYAEEGGLFLASFNSDGTLSGGWASITPGVIPYSREPGQAGIDRTLEMLGTSGAYYTYEVDGSTVTVGQSTPNDLTDDAVYTFDGTNLFWDSLDVAMTRATPSNWPPPEP